MDGSGRGVDLDGDDGDVVSREGALEGHGGVEDRLGDGASGALGAGDELFERLFAEEVAVMASFGDSVGVRDDEVPGVKLGANLVMTGVFEHAEQVARCPQGSD